MNVDRAVANVVVAADNQFFVFLPEIIHIKPEIFQPFHFKGLPLVACRSGGMIDTGDRDAAIICPDETPFVVVFGNAHSVFHVVGSDFCEDSYAAVILFSWQRRNKLCSLMLQIRVSESGRVALWFPEGIPRPAFRWRASL